jgi:hypothetical protein
VLFFINSQSPSVDFEVLVFVLPLMLALEPFHVFKVLFFES